MSREEDRISSLFWTFVVAMMAVHVIFSCKDNRTRTLAVVVIAGIGAAIWRPRASDEAATNASMDAIVAGAAKGPSMDLDMYTLRNVVPSRPLKHLALRTDVVRAVASLRKYVRRDRGKVWRLVACLEDFFARFDAALVGPPRKAARTVRLLLDTRAEAMNVMHSLIYARPSSMTSDVADAIDVVRRVTQKCMSMLWNKHAARSAAVRAEEWRPPYAFDPRKDPRYHVF